MRHKYLILKCLDLAEVQWDLDEWGPQGWGLERMFAPGETKENPDSWVLVIHQVEDRS